jgi:hypothetical protein
MKRAASNTGRQAGSRGQWRSRPTELRSKAADMHRHGVPDCRQRASPVRVCCCRWACWCYDVATASDAGDKC